MHNLIMIEFRGRTRIGPILSASPNGNIDVVYYHGNVNFWKQLANKKLNHYQRQDLILGNYERERGLVRSCAYVVRSSRVMLFLQIRNDTRLMIEDGRRKEREEGGGGAGGGERKRRGSRGILKLSIQCKFSC